jgi:hypothetical protein
MARRVREKPAIIVRRTPRGLSPVSGYDAEQLAMIPLGEEFDVVRRSRRSLPQLRTYWKALTLVVRATDAWPTPEHLHEAIKLDLGYVTTVRGLDGKTSVITDSAGINAMNGEEFKLFFDRAMQRLAEETGIDPLSFLAEAA